MICKTFAVRVLAIVLLAAMVTSVRVPATAQPIDPGIAAAIDREMDAFARGNLDAFLDDFTDNAVVIDDAEPLFIPGRAAIREWFIDNRRGAGNVTLSHGAATDYTLGRNEAFAALPFRLAIGSPPNRFIANGTYTATFVREKEDYWKIRSLTIAILSTGS